MFARPRRSREHNPKHSGPVSKRADWRAPTCIESQPSEVAPAQRLALVRRWSAESTLAKTRSRSLLVGASSRAALSTARPSELAPGGVESSSSGPDGAGSRGLRGSGRGVWKGPWNERRGEALAMNPQESPTEVGRSAFRGRDVGASTARGMEAARSLSKNVDAHEIGGRTSSRCALPALGKGA